MRVAFEIKHGIDDVLEHPRSCERAFLGDVADEDHRGPRLLGKARQLRRALAHLRDRPGRRLQRVGIKRLDRIDDGDPGGDQGSPPQGEDAGAALRDEPVDRGGVGRVEGERRPAKVVLAVTRAAPVSVLISPVSPTCPPLSA